MDRVLLVSMPFGNVKAPALGITLLKGILVREGISCEIRYLQFPFAVQLGLQLYEDLCSSFPSLMLGEWLFAHQVVTDALPGETEYFDTILRQYVSAHGRSIPEDLISRLPDIRNQTEPYLEACMDAVAWQDYHLIGFTSTFAQNMASLALAKRIKQAYPEKIIVLGGANCEGDMGVELHRRFPFLDYVCSGESDRLFPELVHRLAAGAEIHDLEGLVYRLDGETVACGTHAPPVPDMDALPLPDYDDYFAQLDESGLHIPPEKLRLMVETARGCWWGAKSQCVFCGLNNHTMQFRSKSGQRVLEEFTYLAHRYPDNRYLTITDNILDFRYFQDVIPRLIEQDLDLSIWYEVKSNLNKTQLKLLKQAGIEAIQPGIESLDSGILQLMGKGCNVIQNVQVLKWAQALGIYVGWNLISGFPGEDSAAYQRMAEMVPSLFHLQPPTSRGISTLRLDRFSPYFKEPGVYGIENIRPAPAYRFVYPFNEDSLSRLAYYFDFDHADGRQPASYTGPLDQAIRDWHDQGDKGSLFTLTGDGQLTLYDTRVHAHQRQTILEGTAKLIYEYCDEGRTLNAITRYLNQLNLKTDDEAVKNILKSLVDKRLMLHADRRYLSLGIPISGQGVDFVDRFVSTLSLPQGALTGE